MFVKNRPVTASQNRTNSLIRLRRFLVVSSAVWLVLWLGLMAWMIYRSWDDAQRAVYVTAKVSFQKDVVYRTWNAKHGGVFVPVGEHAQPNPYLEGLIKRDIQSVDGTQLTLINPALMTRQVQTIEKDMFSHYGHITSLNPLNKEDNQPDEWERAALLSFEEGTEEYTGLWVDKGQEYYRYMAPFRIKQSCMICHEQQGYKIGDIRGGISVAVPMDETRSRFFAATVRSVLVCLCAWLIGTVMLFWGGRKVRSDIIRRREAEKIISEENEKKSVIMSSIPSILIILDREERVTDWNKTAAEAFGLSRAQAIGHRISALNLGGNVPQVFMNPESDNAMVFPEVRYKRADDQVGIVHFTASFLQNAEGEIVGSVLLGRDVLVDMQRQNEDLHAQKMESIGQLSAGIAHEINTPIQYVGDNVRFLRDAYTDIQKLLDVHGELLEVIDNGCTDDLHKMVEKVRVLKEEIDLDFVLEESGPACVQALEGVQRVAKIVAAMRSFSHQGQEDEKVATDINQCIENTTLVARNEYKYVAELILNLDAHLPQISCVTGAINQVFLNILVNAAHAIEEKIGRDRAEEKGIITITTGMSGDMIFIRFADSGTGVPESILHKVFDPFFTTKKIGKGTGQGMALSHRIIVEEHCGKIEVANCPEGGAEFSVYLPIKGCGDNDE